jgi:hypothetical protein
MNRSRNRRLSQLEKLAKAEAKRRDEWLRQAARDHATRLATLILYGDPKIEEPLAKAWHRALSKLGMTHIHEVHLPDCLRAKVIAALPGDSENGKLARVLGSAAPWLRHFCMASLDAHVLGIDLPKISEPLPKVGRDGCRAMESWPDIPSGTIADGEPIPKENPFDLLSVEECIDLINILQSAEDNWSRRDRHRHNEIMAKVDSEELSRALERRLSQLQPKTDRIDWRF